MKWRELKTDPVFGEIAEKFATLAPLWVGLFGTAYGILYAFENLQSENTISLLAWGIFKGLLFTALGLIILSVVILLHYWFRRRQ